MKKISIIAVLTVILFGVFYFFWITPRYVVPILIYHNIGYGKDNFYVSPEKFARQMEYIKKNGYDVISLGELVESINTKKKLKRNKVVITFDDGYKDNFEQAYPELKKNGFAATIFIIPDLVGGSFENGKSFLAWEDMLVMSRNKISFGAHTKSHYYLGVVADEKTAVKEIEGSKKIIEEKLNLPVEYFCYPGGGFNERVKELVRLAGYKGACATNRGFARNNNDVYELKRIKITNSDAGTFFSFWAKLSGYYNIFRNEKKPY